MANENDDKVQSPPVGPSSKGLPRWMIWVSLVLIILIPLVDRYWTPPHKMKGKTAPDIIFQDANGKASSLAKFRGNTVLVNFWAGWCRPCMEEMPSLKVLEQRFENKKFIVLAINVEEKAEDVQELVKQGFLPKNLFFQPNPETMDAYDVHSIPLSLLIDRSGEMKKAYMGPRDWTDANIIAEIEPLLSP